METPVYIFSGFLESGKTLFIQDTLEDKRFNQGERTVANIVANLNTDTQVVKDNFIDSGDKSDGVAELVNELSNSYSDIGKTVIGMNGDIEKQSAFISDYEAVGEYFDTNESNLKSSDATAIASFLSLYSAYYAQLAKNKVVSDVNRMRVFKNYKSSLYMCSLLAMKDQMVPSKYDEAFVKDGDMIEVGIRRISDRTPYKIPYGSSVSANKLGTPAAEYFPLVFDGGKLIAIESSVLRDNAA